MDSHKDQSGHRPAIHKYNCPYNDIAMRLSGESPTRFSGYEMSRINLRRKREQDHRCGEGGGVTTLLFIFALLAMARLVWGILK